MYCTFISFHLHGSRLFLTNTCTHTCTLKRWSLESNNYSLLSTDLTNLNRVGVHQSKICWCTGESNQKSYLQQLFILKKKETTHCESEIPDDEISVAGELINIVFWKMFLHFDKNLRLKDVGDRMVHWQCGRLNGTLTVCWEYALVLKRSVRISIYHHVAHVTAHHMKQQQNPKNPSRALFSCHLWRRHYSYSYHECWWFFNGILFMCL